MGDFADYCRETGKGHDITYEEAMAILKRVEENGFVHQVINIDGENKICGICNCNVNICNAQPISQLFNTPNMSRAAFVAHVDKDNISLKSYDNSSRQMEGNDASVEAKSFLIS